MAQIDWDILDESHERFDNLNSQLQTVRDLLSADEDLFFNDEGEWTEKGVAVLGTYIQELEMYKNALAGANEQLDKLSKPYQGNEAYYKEMGIDSEQELYDKVQEWSDKQQTYLQGISDTEQAVIGMYESQIDAIEENNDKLVEAYNDYIESVKRALDAERDLYEFKKNVEKQAKDIAAIERRIASLSGSTDKSDIAERRRLESELYDAKENLNDTYYSHAKDKQIEALDEEAEAYNEAMENYSERLRETLEEAQLNMDLFIESVTATVMLNAETIKNQYVGTGVALDNAIVDPWNKAIAAVGKFEKDALSKMNAWTTAEGFFGQFKTNATNQLKSPWSAGTTAANSFRDGVKSAMSKVVENVKSNVQSAKTQLSNLYKQIQDTEKRAKDANYSSNSGSNNGGNDYSNQTPTTTYKQKAKLKTSLGTFYGYGTGSTVAKAQDKAEEDVLTKARDAYSAKRFEDMAIERFVQSWKKHMTFSAYAKGTTGTDKDQWAITDEPWLGDELTMYATKDGTLSYMRAGSTVIPADLTRELIDIGEVGLDGLTSLPRTNTGISLMHNIVNKPELNISFDALVKAERITEETLPAVKKLVTQELEKFSRSLNYSLKRAGAK